MQRIAFILLSFLCSAGLANAQDIMAIDATGNVYLIDSATGSGSLLGPLGFTNAVALSRNSADELYAICAHPVSGQAIVQVDPVTGAGTLVNPATPLYPSERFRGASFDSTDTLWAEHSSSYMVSLPLATGVAVFFNKPAAFDMRSIAWRGSELYGWDLFMGLVLFDTVGTNAAVRVNPGAPGSAIINAMATSPSGQLFGAGDDLFTIDVLSGMTSFVGTGGYSGITAMEFLGVPPNPVLSVTTLTAGQSASYSVTGATPFATVIVGYSIAGPGPTNTSFGVVDMTPPINAFPPFSMDATGSGSWSLTVPGGASGITLYNQGVDTSSGLLTTSLATTIL